MPDFDRDFPPLNSGTATPSGRESKESEEGWELLSAESSEAENDVMPGEKTDAQTDEATSSMPTKANPKMLHHCNSSPDLRVFAHIFGDDDDDDDDDDPEEGTKEDSSFAMVSNVGSVVSWASGQRSFRDAFLSSPIREDKEQINPEPVAPSTVPRPFRKPKIVVQAPALMRRCSKSSPNLLGMIHEDEEILGETDAGDYYYRKSKGAQGRTNGLKLRPDEAKRKAYSVNKRNLQRQSSRN